MSSSFQLDRQRRKISVFGAILLLALTVGYQGGSRWFCPCNSDEGSRPQELNREIAKKDVEAKTLHYYGQAYAKHSEGVQAAFKAAMQYLDRRTPGGGTLRETCSGLVSTFEIETLYLWIRTQRPAFVMEIGSGCGYSAFWILQGLEDNGRGELHSFDASPTLQEFLSPDSPFRGAQRLQFHLGDVALTSRGLEKQWDVVFIDGLHENRFALWYTTELLPRLKPKTPVMVHDIYNPLMVPQFAGCVQEVGPQRGITFDTVPEYMDCIDRRAQGLAANASSLPPGFANTLYSYLQPTGEGMALLSFMATCNCVKDVFTLSPFKNLEFVRRFVAVRQEALGIPQLEWGLNNPSLFFWTEKEN